MSFVPTDSRQRVLKALLQDRVEEALDEEEGLKNLPIYSLIEFAHVKREELSEWEGLPGFTDWLCAEIDISPIEERLAARVIWNSLVKSAYKGSNPHMSLLCKIVGFTDNNPIYQERKIAFMTADQGIQNLADLPLPFLREVLELAEAAEEERRNG